MTTGLHAATALTAPHRYLVLLRELLESAGAMALRPVRRGREQVRRDYDLSTWRSVLETRPWLRCATLRDYVLTADESDRRLIVAKIDDRLVRVRQRAYYEYRLRVLQEVLTQYAGDQPALVELGCGAGVNLLSLYLAGRWASLRGFDISDNGIQAGREAARHFALDGTSFARLDLTDPDDPSFAHLRGQTVFTYYCLEQLKYSTAAVIENLIRAGVRRAIHIEPTTELLRFWSLMDWVTYAYIRRQDYQDNLLRTLRGFASQGRIRIVDVKRLYYSPTPRNDPVVVCWEPADTSRESR
jgi:hypothetical protein